MRSLHHDLKRMRELRAELLAYAAKQEEIRQRLSEHCERMSREHAFPKGGALHEGRYWLIRNRGRTFFPVESDQPFGAKRGVTMRKGGR
ncbi:MAG: hypothetical protein HC882_01890 [Acidobacteria bacterium]|nr:hypothetical protein [Acidobacteriota bacterium]